MRKRLLLLVSASAVAVVLASGWAVYSHRITAVPSFEALMSKGDARGALVTLRAEARDRPADPEPHLRLSDLLLRLGDPAAAEGELKRADAAGADRWAVLTRLGPILVAQKHASEALQRLPAKGPTPEITRTLLLAQAGALLSLDRPTEAASAVAEAETASPGSAMASTMAARVALADNDLPAAGRALEEALKRDPADLDALIMNMRLAIVDGDTSRALRRADSAVAVAPWSTVARLNRAALLMNQGEDAKARDDVEEVLRVQPRDSAGLLARAVLLLRADKVQQASDELERLGTAVASTPRALFFRAVVAARLGRPETALELVSHYLSLDPGDADGVRLLASVDLTLERPGQALAALQRLDAAATRDGRTQELLGRSFTALGRYAEAADAFREASRASPQDVDALRQLGLAEARSGGRDLRDTLNRLAVLGTGSPWAMEALVSTALFAGELDQAAATLAELERQTGQTEQVGLLTGALRLARRDEAGAEAAFQDVVRRFSASVTARLALARVLASVGRLEEAEAQLRPLLARPPADPAVLTTLVQLLASRGKYDRAIALLDAALASDRNAPGLAIMQSELLVRDGRASDASALLSGLRPPKGVTPELLAATARAQVAAGLLPAAKVTLGRAVELSPTDPAPRLTLADLLVREGDLRGARDVLQAGLASSPGEPGIMTALVQVADRQGGLDAALAEAGRLRNEPANQPGALVLRGDALMRANQVTGAAEAFATEMNGNVWDPALSLRFADTLARLERFDEATGILERLLGQPGTPNLAAEAMLSKLDIRAGRLTAARDRLQRLVRARPNDGDALNNLAWSYVALDDPRGLDMAQRAFIVRPSPDAADTVGWALVKVGRSKAAIPFLRQAMKAMPSDAAIAVHLATALRDTGQATVAADLLRRIVEAGKNDVDAEQARAFLRSFDAIP